MKTLITNPLIQSLNPCKDRHDNYLKFYKNKSHTKGQFMGLKNITHRDKIWVAFRLMPLKYIPLAAADIIEAARNAVYVDGSSDDAAAYAASITPRLTVLYKVDQIQDIAFASNHADAYAAAYAASHVVFSSDYAAAGFVKRDKKTQGKLIRKIILKYWR